MSISYGGLSLTPTTAVDAEAQRWWHRTAMNLWDYGGYFQPGIQHLPVPFLPRREPPRLGVLCWPTGADRWATFHLAVPTDQIIALRALVGTSPAAFPLVLTDGDGGTVTAPMYLIDQSPISDRGDDLEYGFATFVDERYFWWQAGAAATPTAAASWAALLTALFASVGVVPTIPAIPAAYLTPNMARWNIGVQPLPLVIEAACRTVGLRTVRNPAGAVTLQNYATASAAEAARWGLSGTECLGGGLLVAPDVARGLPASVGVNFLDGTTTTVTLASLALGALGGVTGVAGRAGLVQADPAAPTAPQKTAYAAQAALDYYRWALTLTDATLRGLVSVTGPCGLDECVEWDHAGRQLTRILRPPWADRNVYGGTPWVSGSGCCTSGSGLTQSCATGLSGGCAPPLTGSGSGSGGAPPDQGYCEAAVDPVVVLERFGGLVISVSSLDVAVDDGRMQLVECGQTEFPLGGYDPGYPYGVWTPVVTRICPIKTTLNYKDHSGTNRTISVVTDISAYRQYVQVASAGAVGCYTFGPSDCCSGSGSGSSSACAQDCDYCEDGLISDIWVVEVDGDTATTLYHTTGCQFTSDDLNWTLQYDPVTDAWVLEDALGERLWATDTWDCQEPNTLTQADGGDDAVLTPGRSCGGTSGVREYSVPGTYTFTAEYTGLHEIVCQGAGGNGAAGSGGDMGLGGGGGGGGAYSKRVFALTSGTAYSVTVGAAGSDSGISSPGPVAICTAKAGMNAIANAGGDGGSGAASLGTTKYDGGDGEDGSATANGGGGGGAAGSTISGTDGLGAVGGAAPGSGGGGAGGNGGVTFAQNGFPGGTFGGGGGGGESNGGSAGAAGGGRVRIVWPAP